jgi:hypothetical protein
MIEIYSSDQLTGDNVILFLHFASHVGEGGLAQIAASLEMSQSSFSGQWLLAETATKLEAAKGSDSRL